MYLLVYFILICILITISLEFFISIHILDVGYKLFISYGHFFRLYSASVSIGYTFVTVQAFTVFMMYI